ncbi:hypothetical protein RRG08_018531 [Elysia crispata]|uniref:Uncharacterized protein n=1 Tax=Elysia crispata TaxID=231223 RepID=A0AAE0YD90_9GAST|nr:hypothetical protein RRG08_018531 [Elysia crispata]
MICKHIGISNTRHRQTLENTVREVRWYWIGNGNTRDMNVWVLYATNYMYNVCTTTGISIILALPRQSHAVVTRLELCRAMLLCVVMVTGQSTPLLLWKTFESNEQTKPFELVAKYMYASTVNLKQSLSIPRLLETFEWKRLGIPLLRIVYFWFNRDFIV